MKKLLLSLTLFGTILSSNSQTTSDDFETGYTIGNIGTILTGATPGQNNWFTYVAASGLNSDFQIINVGAPHNNVAQITGSATASNSRWLIKDISTDWSSRTSGNNIIEITFDLFTGASQTGAVGSKRLAIYDSTGAKLLGGIQVDPVTFAVRGLANITPAGGTNGNYTFKLGAANSELFLTADTWYKFGVSWNQTTGEIKWRSTGLFDLFFVPSATTATGNPGLDVGEMDFLMTTTTGNTVSGIFIFDNVKVNYTSTDTLLGIKDNSIDSNVFSVYPNPSKNFIKISNSLNAAVNNVEIADLNGRVVKNIKFDDTSDAQINISDLSTGIYIMKIVSDKGTTTKKIIKE